MTELKLLVTSVHPSLNAYIVYGNCVNTNKKLSVYIKKALTYKEPSETEVWLFSCTNKKDLINYRPRYHATSAKLLLVAFEVEGEVALFERALKQYELPTLTKKLFLGHPEFKGIGCGKSRILKAIKRVGSTRQFLTELKNGNLAALVDAFNNIERGLAFLTAYQNVNAEFDSIEFIDQAGYDKRTAHRLFRLLGRSTKSLLTSNPYAPLRMGTRFNNAWVVAEKLRNTKEISIPDDSPIRLIGAIDFVVYRALNQNHTAISETKFRVALSSLIGEHLIDVAIDLGLSQAAICRTSKGDYQGVGLAYLESIVERSIASKVASSREGIVPKESIYSLISEFDEYSSTLNGFSLTEEQKKLAFNAITNDLSIAQGEGGTGKSTAMACVKYACNRLGRPAYFVAVAGIAKKKINDELERMCVIQKQNIKLFGESQNEVCCYTVRGLIRQIQLTLDNPEIKGAIQLNNNPLFVFDESSMLDLSLTVEFLSLLDKHVSRYSISMVGDIAQIAPVGFGVVWQHVVNLCSLHHDSVPYSELKHVHRQDSNNPIREVARLVRTIGHSNGIEWSNRAREFSKNPLSELIDLSSFSGQPGVYYLQLKDSQIIPNAYSVSKQLGLDKSQVITPYSNSDNPLSTDSINNYFIANERHNYKSTTLWGFAKGERVIVTHNSTSLDLYNGDIATITDIVHKQEDAGGNIQKKLVCKFSKKTIYIDEDQCFDTGLVHCYGITIHKTQGSEFPYTIVLVPKSTSTAFMENSMIYTALTRSKIATIFIGDMDTLTRAVNSSPAYMRICTGFNLKAELHNQSLLRA